MVNLLNICVENLSSLLEAYLIFDFFLKARITTKEKQVWISFKRVLTEFLGNVKDPYHEFIGAYVIDEFKNVDCLTILEVYFLNNYFDFFLKFSLL